jgi:hypothetical protein
MGKVLTGKASDRVEGRTGWKMKKKAVELKPTAFSDLAPQVRLELTTLRLTAGCSAIELLRNKRPQHSLKT